MASTTKSYRPANYPSLVGQGGDARYLKQELDKLSQTVNGLNQLIQNGSFTLTSPANTLKGNNTGALGPTLDLTVAQIQTMLGIGMGRVPLLANTTFYVSTTGSDSSGLGTSVSPWATLNHAILTITSTYDFNNKTVTLQLADGTYTSGGFFTNGWVGGGAFVVNGNASTPANVVISTTTQSCFVTSGPPLGGSLTIQNLEMTVGGLGGSALQHGAVGPVNFGPGCIFGSVIDYHMAAVNPACTINALNNYTLSGGAKAHWYTAAPGAQLYALGITVTLTTNVTFSTAWAFSQVSSFISCQSDTFTLGGHTVTGTRYTVIENGIINTNGAGATYIPGSAPGTAGTQGQYI